MLRRRRGWKGNYNWNVDGRWNGPGWDSAALRIDGTRGVFAHGLSLVAGTAFIFLSGVDLSSFAGADGSSTPWKIKVKDASGNTVTGFIGSVGSGETLSGSELILNPGFETLTSGTPDDGVQDNFGSWSEGSTSPNYVEATATKYSGNYACKAVRGAAGSSPFVLESIATGAGNLFKTTFWTRGDASVAGIIRLQNTGTGTGNAIGASFSGTGITTGISGTTYTQVTMYGTANGTTASYILSLTLQGTVYFDDTSLQQVTEPIATGVHIVSTKGGGTRDWTSIGASFNYCIPAGYPRVEVQRA